jgi:DNA-binding CsgD family transcriptional regulator
MPLSSNHIFYTATPDIANIVKPLNKLGITYFTFTRNYHDGSRLYLQDHSVVLDIYLKGKHYSNGNTECRPEIYKDQTLLWSTVPDQKVLDKYARALGFDHGIFMFEPHNNYCEIFSFATHSGNDRIVNTYLSKMDLLKSFREYFREKAEPIIKQAENQKLILPFNETLDIKSLLTSVENNEILPSKPCHNDFLTNRQFGCCSLLLKGKTAKEIGAILNLSTRTVEHYFDVIKTKLDCKNKAELIFKLTSLMK